MPRSEYWNKDGISPINDTTCFVCRTGTFSNRSNLGLRLKKQRCSKGSRITLGSLACIVQ